MAPQRNPSNRLLDPTITQNRNANLIGHSIGAGFQALKKAAFVLNPKISIPATDTGPLCREVFNIAKDWTSTLIDLVGWLWVSDEHVRMHCAGNDANLPLKILLMLAMESCDSAEMSAERIERN
ncbi:hypothetical protein BDZ45DRAFT_743038 [Acephala macrosclerotiorum]|nr:hypothetical protein BDZ45DRAFT_743038 [Acephala macrosclerotiorum]